MIHHIERRTASKQFRNDGYTQRRIREHGKVPLSLEMSLKRDFEEEEAKEGGKAIDQSDYVHVGKPVIVSHLHMQNPIGREGGRLGIHGWGVFFSFSSRNRRKTTSKPAQVVCVCVCVCVCACIVPHCVCEKQKHKI